MTNLMRSLLVGAFAATFAASASAQVVTPPTFTNQSLNLGTGTLSAAAAAFTTGLTVTQTANTYVVTGNPRNIMYQTTLSPTQNTSTIWENANSFTYVNGPGIQNGEVNGFHSYFQVNTGGNLQLYENFEASTDNTATLNTGSMFLASYANDTTGNTTNITGVALRLINNNTTSGSVTEYNGIDLESMTGSGTVPTLFYFLRNAESRASSNFLGSVNIGTLSTAPGGYFVFRGPDTSGGTYAFQILNSAGTNIIQINDAGGMIVGSSGNATVSCTGTPSSGFAVVNGFVTHC